MSYQSEYKYYIVESIVDFMSANHLTELKQGIENGVYTNSELYKNYNDLYKLETKEDLLTYEIWFREQRLKKLLNTKNSIK